ncbi:MAG: hypothetical protein JWM06_3012 [Actinomycetia bacterium]|nr:hypothetical protein [Actinomycetes bacterium]
MSVLIEGDVCPTCKASQIVLCECGQGEPAEHLICLGCGEDPPDCDCPSLEAAAIEARRKPLAPPEIAGSICAYAECTADPVFEQDTPIGRLHFCEAHSDEMALDVLGVEG